MIDDIKQRLEGNPFLPFSIVTSGGMKYRIASRDHADINPKGNRVVIWFDDGGSALVASLHITAIEDDAAVESPARPGFAAS